MNQFNKNQLNKNQLNKNQLNAKQHNNKHRNGFSLSEALVFLTLLCIVFVVALQWYLHRSASQPAALPPIAAVSMQAGEEVLFDDAIPLGAPIAQDGLFIHFGTGAEAVSVHVPGHVVSANLPVGPDNQTAEVHWFQPE